MVERVSRASSGFLILLAATLMVGCIGSTDPPAPASEDAIDEVEERQSQDGVDPQPAEPWSLEQEMEAGWTAGVGAGGPVAGVSDCYGLTWKTPEGTDDMSLGIGAAVVGERGVGTYEVRLYDGSNSSKLGPYTEEEVLGFENPTPGSWSIELDPLGPVVDQHWAFSIKLDGEGTDSPDWSGLSCIDQ